MEAVVEYDYQAAEEDELNLVKGEIIFKCPKDGWRLVGGDTQWQNRGVSRQFCKGEFVKSVKWFVNFQGISALYHNTNASITTCCIRSSAQITLLLVMCVSQRDS